MTQESQNNTNPKQNQAKVEEPEIVKDGQVNQYKHFFAQLDDKQFSGIGKKVILRGMLVLFVVGLLFFAFFGAAVWLLFHLLPFIFAFFLFIFVVGGFYSALVYLYENFMKGKS